MKVWLTGTSVYWPSEDSDDYVDEHGYVSPSWSLTDLYADRADVEPAYDGNSVSDAAGVIRFLLCTIEDSGSAPTFYGTHENAPLDDEMGRTFTYAAHIEGCTDVQLDQLCAALAS